MGRKSKNLPLLPVSTDKFWEEAETEQRRLEAKQKCQHVFERITGAEIACQKCRCGFMVEAGYEVKDGHIFLHGSFII